ncbi:MAG: PilX N-terminal domain-containing pilus assembly protein [Pseudomonas sp.]
MTPQSQRGSVLIVTLVLLLVVTALALSSVHDSVLETQVMNRNLEQQRLFNAAEAGLRDAERRIARATAPLSPCGAPPCLHGMASNNAVDFARATPYQGSFGPGPAAVKVRWYIRQIAQHAHQPHEAAYGDAAKTSGTFYYEVSSQAFFPHLAPPDINANCLAAVVCLRSVVARTFVEERP